MLLALLLACAPEPTWRCACGDVLTAELAGDDAPEDWVEVQTALLRASDLSAPCTCAVE